MPERILTAPLRLVIDTRIPFRDAAVELLDELTGDDQRLVIDMSGTREIDTTGMNALMLIQRRAAARRKVVCLRDADQQIRSLLTLTRLAELFDFEDETASA